MVGATHQRHHRHVCLGVLPLLDQGQRPEVWRCPVEDDGEQVQRREVQGAGHAGPAHQRGERAGGAADHDVLRAPALEADGVDEDIEEQTGQGQPGGERVDEGPEQREGHAAQGQSEQQRRAGRDATRGDWPGPGAGHDLVNVPVEPHVDGVGAAGHQVAAQHDPADQPEGGHPRRGDEHRRDGGHQEQRDDPRLGQGDQVGEQRGRRGTSGLALWRCGRGGQCGSLRRRH